LQAVQRCSVFGVRCVPQLRSEAATISEHPCFHNPSFTSDLRVVSYFHEVSTTSLRNCVTNDSDTQKQDSGFDLETRLHIPILVRPRLDVFLKDAVRHDRSIFTYSTFSFSCFLPSSLRITVRLTTSRDSDIYTYSL